MECSNPIRLPQIPHVRLRYFRRCGQVLIRRLSLHSINFIVVFCIGITAFTAFLNAFRQPVSVLAVVAGAFPKGATFFVSWSLLIVGLQNGLEIALFGISWINHSSYVQTTLVLGADVTNPFLATVSANTSLRERGRKTLSPVFSAFKTGELDCLHLIW